MHGVLHKFEPLGRPGCDDWVATKMPISRRAFVNKAGLLAAGATLAAPALANPSPEIRWTMTSAFQPALDLVCSGSKTCAAAVLDMTDGRFAISVQPVGSIASAIDALDAVADGKADCAHTALSYSWTKNHPAYFFGSGVPFGVNARQHAAWLRTGGGSELIDDLLAERGLMAMPLAAPAARWPAGSGRSEGAASGQRPDRHEGPHRRVCGKGSGSARRDGDQSP